MVIYITLMETEHLVLISNELPPVEDGGFPADTRVFSGEIAPDDVKKYIDVFIEDKLDVVVSPGLVHSCGIRESDFKDQVAAGQTKLITGTVDEILEEYEKLKGKDEDEK